MPEMNMIQALNQALHLEFARDERLYTFGEDCGAFGGVLRVTSGLQEKFGEERCFDTPLTELGIVGFAIGMSLYGLRPVCEIQFADYIFPAYDQIVNEMAKMRYRTGGQFSCPLVIRTPYGGGIKGGHYHSQSPEAQFLHTPGLHVVVPSNPYDAKGLLLASIRSNDPVIFLEPKRIYRSSKGEVPEEDYEIPLAKGKILRSGKDVTLIGWGAQIIQNMAAAEQVKKEEGLDVEVIDLRSLCPLDTSLIISSVQKTARCVIAHEAPRNMGYGAELAALLSERCFLHLEAPIMRCCGLDTPFPHTLEHEYLPESYKVKQTLLEVMDY